MDGHNQTKMTCGRFESAITDVKGKLGDHEERIVNAKEKLGQMEDVTVLHQRARRHLLHLDIKLTVRCEDLQNRLRRNDLRIYQVPEASEKGDMVGFVKDMLPPELDIKFERTHRPLVEFKPKNPADSRCVIVRFLDAAVKDMIIKQARSQKEVLFQGKWIFFDHDYSSDLQRKRTKAHKVAEQLKKRDTESHIRPDHFCTIHTLFYREVRSHLSLPSGVKHSDG